MRGPGLTLSGSATDSDTSDIGYRIVRSDDGVTIASGTGTIVDCSLGINACYLVSWSVAVDAYRWFNLQFQAADGSWKTAIPFFPLPGGSPAPSDPFYSPLWLPNYSPVYPLSATCPPFYIPNYPPSPIISPANSPVPIGPLADLDAYHPGWQSVTNATPDILATAGLNYIALSAPPDAADPITLDVIRNAIIPTDDTDFIQIGREMVSAILSYAEHLAMFKVGGDEWEATNPGFEQLLTMAANYNNRMSAASRIWKALNKVTNAEEPTRQRIITEPEK